MNLMLINVSTRKLRRAVRLPEGDLPIMAGDGTSKSAASRRFVALSAERLAKWMASDLSKIDGVHIGNDLVLVTALGIDGNGDKHPLGLDYGRPCDLASEVDGENGETMSALLAVTKRTSGHECRTIRLLKAGRALAGRFRLEGPRNLQESGLGTRVIFIEGPNATRRLELGRDTLGSARRGAALARAGPSWEVMDANR
jgi:hypothetical protein